MSRGSVLPQGMTLVGEIRGQGDLVIAGSVEGPIAIDGHLTIEASGSVRGEVKARAMVLRGTLAGHAIAEETIRLEVGARMVGDARAERVSVVEGALLRGRITMTGAQPSRRSSAGQLAAPSAMVAPSTANGPATNVPAPSVSAPAARAPVAPSAVSRGAPGPRSRSPGASLVGGGPASATDVASAARVAPRAPSGVLIAPRDREPPPDDDADTRATGRFVRRSDSAVPVPVPAQSVGEGARPRPDRRPPEPVIPGVGRQRARRKDGGITT